MNQALHRPWLDEETWTRLLETYLGGEIGLGGGSVRGEAILRGGVISEGRSPPSLELVNMYAVILDVVVQPVPRPC